MDRATEMRPESPTMLGVATIHVQNAQMMAALRRRVCLVREYLVGTQPSPGKPDGVRPPTNGLVEGWSAAALEMAEMIAEASMDIAEIEKVLSMENPHGKAAEKDAVRFDGASLGGQVGRAMVEGPMGPPRPFGPLGPRYGS